MHGQGPHFMGVNGVVAQYCKREYDKIAQALLDEWRAEAARKPLGMTEAEACQVLEVSLAEDQELDDEMLKAAYRYVPSRRGFHGDSLNISTPEASWACLMHNLVDIPILQIASQPMNVCPMETII